MKVLFRAEVKNVGSLSQSSFSPLVQIGKRYYAIGIESYSEGDYYIRTNDARVFICKEKTRSINLSDMLDSDKKPIFASLSKDGKGGDICECISEYQKVKGTETAIYNRKRFYPFLRKINFENKTYKDWYSNIKVIGIQE